MKLDKEIYTTQEAAEYLGITVNGVYDLIKRGKLNPDRFNGVYMFKRDDLKHRKASNKGPGWPKGRPRKKTE